MSSDALPPGPLALPVLGNLPGMMRDPLSYFARLNREYGGIVSFRFGSQTAILVSDPTWVDSVLRDRRFERSVDVQTILNTLLGAGLLSLEGSSHLQRRRLIAPAFHRLRIRSYVDVMTNETERMIRGWNSGEQRDLRTEMFQLTFAIVARALFNANDTSEADRVASALKRVRPWVVNMSMLSRVFPFRTPWLHVYAARTGVEIQNVVRAIVRARRKDNRDYGDLLSMLSASLTEDGGSLSDDEICAETLTMLLAGHETSAHALSWAWYLLTRHPAVLEALRSELNNVVGARSVTFDDLPRLQLLDRVVRETLRLYPPTWAIDRISKQPTRLAGYSIPANTGILLSPWVMHRDPHNFADPERFDPGRFLPERIHSIPDNAYTPFGAGVHMCIGQGFALTEVRVILASMVQQLSIRAVHRRAIRPQASVGLAMSSAFPVVATRRNIARDLAQLSIEPNELHA